MNWPAAGCGQRKGRPAALTGLIELMIAEIPDLTEFWASFLAPFFPSGPDPPR
jgi:hypothetical protein